MVEERTLSIDQSTEIIPALCSIFQIIKDPKIKQRRIHTFDKIRQAG